MEQPPFVYTPKNYLNEEEFEGLSSRARGLYGLDPLAFMRHWNAAVKGERERTVAIFRMQRSLGPEFASLAEAIHQDGRYTAADLAKLAGAKIAARMGNVSSQVKLAEVDADARSEWNRSAVVRTTFRNKFADYHAFRAFAAVNKGGAR